MRLEVLDTEPTFFSQKVPYDQHARLHIIRINIPNVRMHQCDELPSDVPISVLRSPAVFSFKPNEIVIESLVYSVGELLGEVSNFLWTDL